ncbi:ABC transporter permease [Falsiroseomonas sp. E2-1-a20]|uniref:ABC transporter permease n=1 Tax=Falsiroseomonas sp. E2-1-a20 TaxID=3239300 RepID=UPI003F2F3E03
MSDAAALPIATVAGAADPPVGIGQAILRTLRSDPGAALGCLFIAIFALTALLAPWISPYEPTAQHIVRASEGPSAHFWLGTDDFGRDLLSRIIHGSRPALLVGVLSVLVAIGLGVPVGMLAGYHLGWVDRVVGWVVDIMLALPSLLLALMVVALLGASTGVLVLAIGISHVPIFVRLARSSTMVVRNLEFVSQARSFGASDLHILRRHILPNIIGPLIIMGTLSIAGAIREEASLSFLGLGVQAPHPSWGNLIRDGVADILESPHLAILPGIALTLAVLAFNMVGDSLRDMLDPRDLTASDVKKK